MDPLLDLGDLRMRICAIKNINKYLDAEGSYFRVNR